VNAPLDLTNCDREPIHIPGTIQTHGVLIACDSTLTRITRYSLNAHDMLNLDDREPLIGQPLEAILGPELTHMLRNELAAASITRRPALRFGVDLNGSIRDLAVHRAGNEVIVEFETSGNARTQPLNIVRTVIARAMRAKTLDGLTTETARLVRALLGYDRVMVYRFEPDGSGQVVSEAKSAQLESFLGQYFPAGDIPKQARDLYLRNTIRIISDSNGTRIPIVPEESDAGGALDMSHAHLRSVSLIHCEYLRNMGVSASMSISIVIDGALWGMVACHHYSPKHLDMAERAAIELFGEFLSIQLDLMRQKKRIASARAARQALDEMLRASSREENVPGLLVSSLPEFARMIPCDGVGLWVDESWSMTGLAPDAEAVPDLIKSLRELGEVGIWSTDRLGKFHPAAAEYCDTASGILAIPLSQRPKDYLLFFRREFEHTLNWAGNPEKTYASGPLGDRLTPRKSFAIWKETVRNQSRPWTDSDRETAEAIRAALVEVVLRHNEVMAEERGRADVRQRMLNEELNHRVKNILAVIKSLVGQASPPDRTLGEYLAVLRGRIEALAVAHDQVVRGDGGGFLLDLLKAELRPYGEQAASIDLDGPSIWVDTTAFSVLALVFHELATNAAKYGALSRTEGRLSIHWDLDEAGDCVLVWQEQGGPGVRPPRRSGFGTVLITRSVPHDLGGESEVDYRPEGLRARFSIPARNLTSVENGPTGSEKVADPRMEHSLTERAPVDMADLPILLVEDQMLIALDAEMMLSESGMTNVVTVSSASEALTRLKDFRPAVAVLDVNLGVGTSIGVAEELQRMGTPFLFATGYGDTSAIPAEFADISIVRKPYSARELAAAIQALVGSG
jgi:light-regulated signal transduction histidine kinase (bacteriophytochrome)/CheY-like chemotaxis protein